MLRPSLLLAMTLLALSALGLYTIASKTQRLARDVAARERLVEQTLADIRVLSAERAFLSRPERIAPLATALGLGPPKPGPTLSGEATPSRR